MPKRLYMPQKFEIWNHSLRHEGAWRRGQGGHNSPDAVSLRGVPKSSNNITSTFFNAVHLLPKDLRFEHRGAKLASCPGNHLTLLRPWQHGYGSQSSPNPRTQIKAATIASYRVCHVLGKHNQQFEDGDILKKAFLDAANSLFENFNNKTYIVKAIKKCNSPFYKAMRGNSYVCGGATEEGYWHVWVLSPSIDEMTDMVDVEQLCVFIGMGFKDMSAKEELLTILPLQRHWIRLRIFLMLLMWDLLTRQNCCSSIGAGDIATKVKPLFDLESSALEDVILTL